MSTLEGHKEHVSIWLAAERFEVTESLLQFRRRLVPAISKSDRWGENLKKVGWSRIFGACPIDS